MLFRKLTISERGLKPQRELWPEPFRVCDLNLFFEIRNKEITYLCIYGGTVRLLNRMGTAFLNTGYQKPGPSINIID